MAEASIRESESRERIPDLAVQSERVRDRSLAQHRGSTKSTATVSEGFESERIKEKNRFEIMYFSKVQNGIIWTFTSFFNNKLNPVPTEICISGNLPKLSGMTEMARNCPKSYLRWNVGILVPVCIPV